MQHIAHAACGALFALAAAGAVRAAPSPPGSAVAPRPVFSLLGPASSGNEMVLGNPTVAGQPFVVRLQEMPGEIVPPHTHHFDENITVVRGTWYFGIGPKYDPAALHRLPTGSFVFVPHGTPMFAYAPTTTTVQIHGVGPWNQHFVGGLYTLTAKADVDGSSGADPTRFRFRAGQAVSSARGEGHILEGFVTGGLVQYVVAKPDHQIYAAQEKDLRKR